MGTIFLMESAVVIFSCTQGPNKDSAEATYP